MRHLAFAGSGGRVADEAVQDGALGTGTRGVAAEVSTPDSRWTLGHRRAHTEKVLCQDPRKSPIEASAKSGQIWALMTPRLLQNPDKRGLKEPMATSNSPDKVMAPTPSYPNNPDK